MSLKLTAGAAEYGDERSEPPRRTSEAVGSAGRQRRGRTASGRARWGGAHVAQPNVSLLDMSGRSRLAIDAPTPVPSARGRTRRLSEARHSRATSPTRRTYLFHALDFPCAEVLTSRRNVKSIRSGAVSDRFA